MLPELLAFVRFKLKNTDGQFMPQSCHGRDTVVPVLSHDRTPSCRASVSGAAGGAPEPKLATDSTLDANSTLKPNLSALY